MSKVKANANLFMGEAEMKRLQATFSDEGFTRHTLLNTKTFGLIREILLPDLGNIPIQDCFKVVKAGTPIDQVIVQPGIALDSNGQLIVNESNQNFAILNSGSWFYIIIKQKYSNLEKGTLTVDSLGNVVGVGTEFTKKLRGQPNFPQRISFPLSTAGNTAVYEVVKVIDDTNLIIAGDFTVEADLQYAVFGCFTPGFVAPTDSQYIFDYDSCDITVVAEPSLGVPPPITSNIEFYIARVKFDGTDLTIEDKRTQFWKDYSSDLLSTLNRSFVNKVTGVEKIKWDIKSTPKNTNELSIAWAFRSVSYTLDTSARKITVLAGQGGVFKDTSFFTTGDFNGWRLYAKNGTYRTILSSVKTGSQISLTLDILDNVDYPGSSEIVITPPFEQIQIRARNDASIPGDLSTQLEMNYDFDINQAIGKVYLRVPRDLYKYNLTYRYKTFNDYTDWINFNNDAVGFFTEKGFDDFGEFLPIVISNTVLLNQAQGFLKAYTASSVNGFIELNENINSYENFVANIDLGDLLGVDTVALANAAFAPTLNLFVGTNRMYEYFSGADLTLTGNGFIQLMKTKADLLTSLRNGNTFLLHFKQKISPSTFKLRIVQDYVDPTTFTLLKEFSVNDFAFLADSPEGMYFRCTFDGTNWIINSVNETSQAYVKQFVMIQYDPHFTAPGPDTLIPTLTYTTPNDGITRKYMITFSTTGVLDSDLSAQGIQTRIFNATASTILDNTNLEHNKFGAGVLNSYLSAGMNCQWMGDLGPAVTIEADLAQIGSSLGGYVSKSKLIIQELK